jgi:hypothetical protein
MHELSFFAHHVFLTWVICHAGFPPFYPLFVVSLWRHCVRVFCYFRKLEKSSWVKKVWCPLTFPISKHDLIENIGYVAHDITKLTENGMNVGAKRWRDTQERQWLALRRRLTNSPQTYRSGNKEMSIEEAMTWMNNRRNKIDTGHSATIWTNS